MSEIFRLRSQKEIDEEAAVWVWRLDSGQLTEAEQGNLAKWLASDPRHRRALDELSTVWKSMDGLKQSYVAPDVEVENLAQETSPWKLRSPQLWWAVAASIALFVLGSVLWGGRNSQAQILATAVGQKQEFQLADGSVVTLNTNSIVRTNLSVGTRDLYLVKGEAHFKVAHDRSRPFLVHVGDTVVRAVGTQFDVRRHANDAVDVIVDEGRVEVRAASVMNETQQGMEKSGVPVRALNAGERLTTRSPDLAVVVVSPQELARSMAWRDGAIVFDGQTLEDAVAEVSRYTDTTILVNDPDVAALPVGGRFKTDDLQGFFDALSAALPVTIFRTEDGHVYIDERG